MKIQYAAPVSEPSGYGEFARNVVSGLVSVGADVLVRNIQLDQADVAELGSKMPIGWHKFPDVSIVNMVPQLFKQYQHKQARLNVIYTMFECDRIPQPWVDACNQADAVLVPSRHSRDAFVNSGVTTQVRWAVPPIDLSLYSGRTRSVRQTDAPFTFYSILEFGERKNPLGLIRAYWAAFTGQTGVLLKLKIYLKGQDAAEKARIEKDLADLRKSVRLAHYPRIQLVWDHLSQEEIVKFHLSSDVYVSATRGEGLGMGLLAALALETPAIASDTSGHQDVGGENGWFKIPCHLTPAHNSGPYAPYLGNALWSEPDLSWLIERMRALFEARLQEGGGTAGVFAGQGAAMVRRQFDQQARGNELVITLQELLDSKQG